MMSALSRWNRRRALEEEKRRAEGRQRREREAMGREDRAMRQLLHKEARARQVSTTHLPKLKDTAKRGRITPPPA